MKNRSPVSGRVPVHQHLADPPPVAVPPIVGEPVREICPHSEAVVVREGLYLPETSILPATPVGRTLAACPHLPGGSFLDHRRPPVTSGSYEHHVNTMNS